MSSRRSASWLELFYDLVFVALVAQFTYVVARQSWDVVAVLTTGIVGYMIFVAWWGTTVSRNLQDSETSKDRIVIQVQMVLALLLSIYLPDVFLGESWFRFVGIYVLIRGLQWGVLLRTYIKYPETRPKTYNIAEGYAVAVFLWLLVAVVPEPYVFVIALMALLVEVLTPLTVGRGNKTRYLNVEHMQERLGLFLLLVMGESVLVVALSNTAVSVALTQPLVVVAGALYMIALWWLYFSHLEYEAEGKRPTNLMVYLHAHAFLFGSVVLVAAAFKNVLTHQKFVLSDAVLFVLGSVLMTTTLLIIREALFGLRMIRLFVSCLLMVGYILVGYISYIYDSLVLMILGGTILVIFFALWDEMRRLKKRAE